MGNDGGPGGTLSPRKEWFSLASPIGVIGGFTALSEIAMVIAAVQTEGGIQLLMTMFAVLFPIGIAAAFFYVLWHRPEVLYPPREYGTTSVADYAYAMRQRNSGPSPDKIAETIEVSIQKAISEREPELLQALSESMTAGHTPSNRLGDRDRLEAWQSVLSQWVQTTAESAADKVTGDLFITLSFQDPETNEPRVERIPIDASTTVRDFLYQTAHQLLGPDISRARLANVLMRYGRDWVWIDRDTQWKFDDMGLSWAKRNGYETDLRPILEVGLRPGMVLELVASR